MTQTRLANGLAGAEVRCERPLFSSSCPEADRPQTTNTDHLGCRDSKQRIRGGSNRPMQIPRWFRDTLAGNCRSRRMTAEWEQVPETTPSRVSELVSGPPIPRMVSDKMRVRGWGQRTWIAQAKARQRTHCYILTHRID